MHKPAAAFLADFGGPGATRSGAVAMSLVPPAPAPLTELQQDHDRAVEEAFERGRSAGRAEMQRELAERDRLLAERDAAVESRIAVARDEGARAVAQALGERIEEGLAATRRAIGDQVAQALRPFLAAAAHKRALTDLERTIRALMVGTDGLVVEAVGPEELLDPLAARMGRAGIRFSGTRRETPDLTIRVGGTVVETRLAAWRQLLEGKRP